MKRWASGYLVRSTLLVLTLLAGGATARAQQANHDIALRLLMTRAELEELIAVYEGRAASKAATAADRILARQEVELIRSRLEMGDFQVGDQVTLDVEREEQLTGTFTVVATHDGPALRLPVLGDVPLRGVLRSEIQSHLRGEIGRFVRDPVVYATALIRLSVLDGVMQPGFYPVPAEALLTDVLMTAGGPSQRARLDKIRIERGKERIWTGDALQSAIIEGRTLDQLSLRAGDRIIVPERSDRSWLTILQASAIVIPAVFALARIF